MKLKGKIILSSTVLVVATLIVITSVVIYKSRDVEKDTEEILYHALKQETTYRAEDVYALCQVTHDMLKKRVASDLRVATDVMNKMGKVTESKSDKVSWNAVNQFTKSSQTISLPKMMVGKTWLGQNRSMSSTSPVVDKVKDMVGGTCTIFQRMNDAGDMLRVCTNVEKLDGQRAIGTYIPRTNPDGQENKVIQTVLSGQTYIGRAFVVNAWYITAYKPIYDGSRVIGILYAGIKQESVKSLRQAIQNMKVGKSGYVFIIGAKGNQKHRYVISYQGTADGKDLTDAKDSNGNYVIREMVEKALKLENKPGEIDYHRYPWKNKGETEARVKLSAIAYFAPWDWMIGAGLYEDDSDEEMAKVATAFKSMLFWSIVFSIILLLIGVAVSYVIGRGIAKPVISITQFANSLAEGDLSESVNIESNDEIGEMSTALNKAVTFLQGRSEVATSIAKKDLTKDVELASEKDMLGKAFQTMIHDLRSFMVQMQDAAQQVSSGATEISDASQSLSQGATEQAASLEEISSSLSEITSQTKTNAENASQANSLTKQARDEADQGDKDIDEMLGAMEEINSSSQQIAKIIKAIDDIAFQTNILALNAAVEAARAGVHGKGFAVVADEVRTLASRSAKAAAETAELIEQASVKVNRGQEVATRTNESIKRVIERIVKITDISAEIAAASNEQAQSISEINIALGQVDQVTQQNTAHAEETAASSEELSSQARIVSSLINEFHVDSSSRRRPAQSQPTAKPAARATIQAPPQQKPPVKATPLQAGKPAAEPKAAGQWGGGAKQEPKKPAAGDNAQWGGGSGQKTQQPKPEAPKPAKDKYEDIISLEDNDFGRY